VPPLNSDAHSAMDKGLLGDPRAALDAAQRETLQGYAVLTAEAARQLELRDPPAAADLPQWQRYLDELQDYLSSIDLHGTRGGEWDRLLALVHACDHLQRLHERLEEEQGRARTVATAAALDLERLAFLAAERSIAARLEAGQHAAAHDEADALAGQIQASVAPFRESVTADMASHALSFEAGTERLEAIRWLERVTHHLARITLHLQRAADASGR
jgi:phosphate:Na+ symporter